MIHQATRTGVILATLALVNLFQSPVSVTNRTWSTDTINFDSASNWSGATSPTDFDGLSNGSDIATFYRGSVPPKSVLFGYRGLPIQQPTPDHETVDRLIVGTNALTFANIAGSTATIVSGRDK